MRITFLGDVMIKKQQISKLNCCIPENYNSIFEYLKDDIASSDYTIVNLETPIAGQKLGYTSELYSFNAPIAFGKAIKNAGIDMCITANNHCLDRGIDGLKNTIINLKNIGLKTIGTHIEKDKSYVIEEFSGVKVGFLAYTYGTNAFSNHEYLEKKTEYMVDMFQYC